MTPAVRARRRPGRSWPTAWAGRPERGPAPARRPAGPRHASLWSTVRSQAPRGSVRAPDAPSGRRPIHRTGGPWRTRATPRRTGDLGRRHGAVSSASNPSCAASGGGPSWPYQAGRRPVVAQAKLSANSPAPDAKSAVPEETNQARPPRSRTARAQACAAGRAEAVHVDGVAQLVGDQVRERLDGVLGSGIDLDASLGGEREAPVTATRPEDLELPPGKQTSPVGTDPCQFLRSAIGEAAVQRPVTAVAARAH